MIIDSQVHAYERDHPGRPWAAHLHGPPEVTGEQLVAAMDSVGVDAAVLVSAWTLYRYDASYALSVRDAWPDRFALVKPVDLADPAVGEMVADWAATAGAVAIRILDLPADPADPGLASALSAATRLSLPVNILALDQLDRLAAVVRDHPGCRFVIDHLGLRPPVQPPVPADPFRDLPSVLALARYDNVAIKVSGVGALSAGPFPFADLWEPLSRVFDAFGFDRCMWGSDWTRAVDFLSYREAVDAFLLDRRFSEDERAALMGGTLRNIYRWTL
jgi:predicted TIM-barrel fold metal-dependent hydrolase